MTETNNNSSKYALAFDRFSTIEKISDNIQRAGKLSIESINEIRSNKAIQLNNAGNSFFSNIGVIDIDNYKYCVNRIIELVLYPATLMNRWYELPIREQRGEAIRLRTVIISELLGALKDRNTTIKNKFEVQHPLLVQGYIKRWELHFIELERELSYYGYRFSESLFYPFIEIWLNELKVEYTDEKFYKRLELMKHFEQIEGGSEKKTKKVKEFKNSPTIDKCNSNTLEGIFKTSEAYYNIIAQLAEEQLIDKTSHYWIDNTKGYQSRVVALLYHLFHNGYYNCKTLPQPETIIQIALNTFNISVSLRTVKSKEINDLRKKYSFIKRYH